MVDRFRYVDFTSEPNSKVTSLLMTGRYPKLTVQNVLNSMQEDVNEWIAKQIASEQVRHGLSVP